MIAADSSSLVAYFQGDSGADVTAIVAALSHDNLILHPVVVAELLSDPNGAPTVASTLAGLPRLELTEGYWERAGKSRSIVLARGLRARLPDALIAQGCIDHNMPLIARDGDYRHFAKHCGLVLA